MRKFVNASMMALACVAAFAAEAQPAPTAAAGEGVEEIVVTASRTGVPVWQVVGPTTTLVLVGAIDGIVRDTRWNPDALTQALKQADRVMFPTAQAITMSPFAAVGYLAKWRAHATLPKGQSLQALLPPTQFARLEALKARGVIGGEFARKHPFHLARELREGAEGDLKFAPNAVEYVRRAVKANKLTLVPITRRKAKPVADDFFGSPPAAHVPCLVDAITAAESGPAAVKARSDAWAARRVADVLNSPADRVHASCWPAGSAVDIGADEVKATMLRLLSEPQTTMAVVPLRMLAEKGGLLDGMVKAGFEVIGPKW